MYIIKLSYNLLIGEAVTYVRTTHVARQCIMNLIASIVPILTNYAYGLVQNSLSRTITIWCIYYIGVVVMADYSLSNCLIRNSGPLC